MKTSMKIDKKFKKPTENKIKHFTLHIYTLINFEKNYSFMKVFVSHNISKSQPTSSKFVRHLEASQNITRDNLCWAAILKFC